MRVLGLDVSTYVGMYLFDGEDGRGKCIHFPGMKGFTRLQLIAAEVNRTLGLWKPDFAVIESYAFGNRNSLVTLVECGTVVRHALHLSKIRWVEVTPKSLKLWTTGSGKADKKHMAKAIKERWGFVSHSDDIADAFSLGKMGCLGESELLKMKGAFLGG